MNKYTARGLAATAVRGGVHVLVLAKTATDGTHAFHELEAAIGHIGARVARVRRANGRQSVELVDGGCLRVGIRGFPSSVWGDEDIVYCEFEPDPDEVAAIIGATRRSGGTEIVRPL